MPIKAMLGVGLLSTVAACDIAGNTMGSEAACAAPQTYAIGSTATGAIEDKDCVDFQGRVVDVYQFTLTTQISFQLVMQASGFNAELGLYSGQATAAAQGKLIFEVVGSNTVGGTAFLPPGSYFILAGTAESKGGSYTLTSPAPTATGCSPYLYWTLPGATFSGSVTGNDCAGAGSARQDAIGMWLASGQTVNVTATVDKAANILWRTGDATTANLVTRVLTQAGTTQFSFTAPRADAYRVHVNGEPNAIGSINYSVSIQ